MSLHSINLEEAEVLLSDAANLEEEYILEGNKHVSFILRERTKHIKFWIWLSLLA